MEIKILRKFPKLYEIAKIFHEKLENINPGTIRHKKLMSIFYSQFMSEGDLVFDIGANIGNRTDIFVNLGTNVIAVEPQDICINILSFKYKNNKQVTIIKKVCGQEEGESSLMVSDVNTISSCNKEWINCMIDSGRFREYTWEKSVIVKMTTLDKLIEEYGRPVFCKIDVEGFEFEVLKGLSKPIQFISFEFTPEYINFTIDTIKHLDSIGYVEFNYSIGESMELVLPEWRETEKMCEILSSLTDKRIFGDIYVKFRM